MAVHLINWQVIDMNNPILVVFGLSIIWMLHTLILGSISADKDRLAKAKSQAEAIARLYPKERSNPY